MTNNQSLGRFNILYCCTHALTASMVLAGCSINETIDNSRLTMPKISLNNKTQQYYFVFQNWQL